jgi:alginate O-acetyltransferase complex protein AlgI
MLFHTLDFGVFFLVVLAVYWSLPRTPQNVFLILASYLFYGYVHPWFLILLIASTVVDYSLALGMGRFPSHKRLFLIGSLLANLGMLSFFKYFGFFVDNVISLMDHFKITVSRPALHVVLPVGISFYTFQTLSYTIDVYRGKLEPRRNFVDFAAFLAFFPQLVAGPIERATHMLPQFERPRRFDPDAARAGVMLAAWGLFKKLVIADNVSLLANKVFSLTNPGSRLLWVGVLSFCVQIYADFSAYSDIARGTARLLGFDLMKNFDHPYVSQTPSEFWRRWHISLSTWFRDYVYIPLGGSRTSSFKHYRNLFLTFLLSGFWHGASWNFVMWGAYHGLLLVAYQLLERAAPKLIRVSWLSVPRWLVFFALTNLGWLIFRETDIHQLLADLTPSKLPDSDAQRMAAGHLLGVLLAYSSPLILDTALYLGGVYQRARASLPWLLTEAGALSALVLAASFLHSEVPSEFIYFQF